ncbi:acyltransferase family protein [uncultured Citricoccus sp.]|uniref:acyltransferase family protein n=1 Tax=uncultured Citricoccus sp. TaxID=614031 RepID=UPI00260215EC|nr:acyltransferase family protein [uncultured Citricoccus sp.]
MSTETLPVVARAIEQPQYRKRLDIQGLRAIAVVLVIIEHARWGLSGGFTGVDIFFVISGFVITLSLLRGLHRDDRVGFKEFYKRRIFRLMPAATLVILVTAIVSILLVSPLGIQQQAAATGGAALVWVSNIALYFIASDYFSPHVQANPFLHTWSLGVEEQFYMFFPVVIALGWMVARKRRWDPMKLLVGLVVLIGTASFVLSLATSMGETLGFVRNPVQFAFYMMPTRAWEFAVGVLLALALSRRTVLDRVPAPVSTAVSALGLVLIGVGAVVITSAMHFPGYAAFLPVFGAAMVILGGSHPNPVASVLGTKVMTWVGDRSYSLYLWHWPAIVIARRVWPDSGLGVISAVVVAILLADLTYRYVEEPFKRLGYRSLKWRTVVVPGGVFAAAGGACLVLLVGSMLSWNNPQLKAVTDQLNERPVGYKECLSTIPVSQRDMSPCTWGLDRPGSPIYLMGDSNAQQYTEAMIGAAEELRRPLVVATWGGCGFFDAQRHDSEEPTKGEECATYVKDGTAWLNTQASGTVVMATAGNGLATQTVTLAGQSGIDAKAAVWEQALQDQIQTLQNSGHEIMLVATAPHFPDPFREWWHPADCSTQELINSPEFCAPSLTKAEVAQQRQYAVSAETRAAEVTGTPMVDPVLALCSDTCSGYRDGTWIYRDGLHISPEQSRGMSDFFASSLTQ